MSEEALLAWLGGKSYGKIGRKNKHRKISERADDDNGNDDKSSADYIPMETVSREFVKVKNKKDQKELDGRISASIDSNKLKAEQPRSEAKDETRASSTKTKDETRVEKTEQPKQEEKKAVSKQPKLKPVAEESKVLPVELPKPKPVLDLPNTSTDPQTAPTTDPQQGITTPDEIKVKPGDNAQQANPLSTPQSAEAETEATTRAPTARLPSLVGQLPPTETTAVPEIPGGNGELKGIDIGEPGVSQSLPLQLDVPAGASDTPSPSSGVLSDLSAEYQRATSKPISLFGHSIDPASQAYDAADRALGTIQSFNNGLIKAPLAINSMARYLYKPLDMALGTDYVGKHAAGDAVMDQFVDRLNITKEPTNVMERAASALGMIAMPLPGGPATQSAGQFLKEAIIPGTFVRQGAKLGDAYKVSAPGSVVVNEGMVRLHDAVVEQQQKNPAVLNKYDELEPRVTTVPGPEAKALQQRLDMDKKSFIPKFAEANYTDVMLYTAGAALTLGLLAKGYKLAKSPVEGRTILNPTKPIVEETPKSITTAGEASRTLNQNSNYALESQAHRFNDPDLVHDISTYTRSGLSARVEAMANTGTVEVPGYNYQLSASPKALVEFHQSRPIAEQEEVSRAFHILDQVDHAKLVRERKAAVKEGEEGAVDPKAVHGTMPPEPDVQFANEVLARPENAGTVRLMKEIRQAQAKVMEASGRWDKQTADNMLDKRPNYVHNIETDDYKIVDGQTVPKTKGERYIDALRSKHDVESFLPGQDLAPAFERSAVNKPNQAMDAVLANVTSLQSSVIHAYENNVRQRFVEGLLKDPGSEKAVVQLKKGQAPPKGFSAVTYYKDGEAQRVAMEPLVAEQLKFNPHRNAQILNAVGTIRNVFQQATTGILAPFFAATSFAMEASIGSATRARGLRLGYIDQALQASTGGRMAWPGDVLGTMAAGVGAVFKAQRADSILHNTQLLEKAFLANPTTSVAQLEAQMPGFVNKLSRGLAVGNDVNAEGLIGEGRRLYSQSPKGWGMKNGALHSSENELMRNVNEFNAGHVADAFNSVLGNHAGEQWRRIFGGYIHLINNVHDAVRTAKVDQNMGKVKDNALAYEVRRSSGDLGVRGANNTGSSYILADDVSKGAQLASKVGSGKIVGSTLDFMRATIPYINPHIQGSTRFLEQFARQPTTTLMGAINSTTMPQLAALGLAMELGPEYVDHMLNKREEHRKNNYWYLPIPGAHPNDGLEFRIDPALSHFGYPILEVMDSVFGIRQHTANQLGRVAPNAETQGIYNALKEATKEWVGFGYPLPMSLAMSSMGIANRNVTEKAFAVNSEQASGLGEGKNPSSALSVPVQLVLETMIGALGQHAVQAMDAWAATDKKKESALGNAAKQFGFSFATKAPLVGTRLFGGSTYNESGTALAQNTRQLVDGANRVVDAVDARQKALLKNAKYDNIGKMPNMKMGYPGIPEMPPEAEMLSKAINSSGALKAVNGERSAISTSLSGLRAVNAGNVGRHLLVPLKPGREIGGLGYTILNEELLKQEMAKEDTAIENPRMKKNGEERKDQRPTPLHTQLDGVPKVSNGKVQNSKTEQFYRPPTLKEVQGLKNALNERRYQLDLQQASMLEQVEKDTGLKISDVASKIKLSPGQDTAE